MTEPPQDLNGFKKCIGFFLSEGVMHSLEKRSEKSWGVLSCRILPWFLKLYKLSLNVIMSTSGTWKITYHNRKASDWHRQTEATDSLETGIIHLWEAECHPPANGLKSLRCALDQMRSFQRPQMPQQGRSSARLSWCGTAQFPRRGNGHSVSKWWLRRQGITYHLVRDGFAVSLDGGRKPGKCGGREGATKQQNNFVSSWVVLGSPDPAALPGIRSDGWAAGAASERMGLLRGWQRGGRFLQQTNEENKVFAIPWTLRELTHKLINVNMQNAHFSSGSQWLEAKPSSLPQAQQLQHKNLS